jgi:hypothetical protein
MNVLIQHDTAHWNVNNTQAAGMGIFTGAPVSTRRVARAAVASARQLPPQRANVTQGSDNSNFGLNGFKCRIQIAHTRNAHPETLSATGWNLPPKRFGGVKRFHAATGCLLHGTPSHERIKTFHVGKKRFSELFWSVVIFPVQVFNTFWPLKTFLVKMLLQTNQKRFVSQNVFLKRPKRLKPFVCRTPHQHHVKFEPNCS